MLALTRRISLACLLLLTTACATAAGPEAGPMRQRRDSARITRDDLAQVHSNDAFEAVRMLRPNWLRKRGEMSVMNASDIVIYVDNVQVGGPEILRSIPIASVRSLQFMDASSATQRWGTNHVHGAILVETM